MGIQGMELFAIGVVIILFMAVLKQFGILEPMSSFEGKGPPEAPQMANRYCFLQHGCTLDDTASVGYTML